MRGTKAKRLQREAKRLTEFGLELSYGSNNPQQRLTYPRRHLYQTLKGRRGSTNSIPVLGLKEG